MEIEIKAPFVKGHEGFMKNVFCSNGFLPNNTLIEKEDIYFSKKKEKVRLRLESGKVTLTKKDKNIIDNIEVNNEMEFKLPFSTILEAFEMMKFLGYDVKSRKTKVSDFYTCNINGTDYNVELVIVNGKYHYIEIETFGEEEQLEDIEVGFRHILSLVSLDYEDRDARKWHEIIGE